MNLIKRIRDIFIIVAVSIVLVEIAGIWVGNNDYFWKSRQLFINKGGFRVVGENGLWSYEPNSHIKTTAFYHLSRWNSWMEYQCEFETNRFGLVKTNLREDSNDVDFLVLGDSFTEGQGGCPWLTVGRLPAGFPVVLNAGLQGAGILSNKLLEERLSKKLNIKQLIIIAISNDFKRVSLNKSHLDNPCTASGECRANDYWWGVDYDLDHAQLMAISEKKYQQKEVRPTKQITEVLRYYSTTYRLLNKLYIALTSEQKTKNKKDYTQAFEMNFKAFDDLISKYPDLKLILVPQKDEVGVLGKENQDTKIAKAFLEKKNIDYAICDLELSDYMPIDGHPNAAGYKKLFQCLDNTIKASR
jgi:lysophospholipase L1-like esterase